MYVRSKSITINGLNIHVHTYTTYITVLAILIEYID